MAPRGKERDPGSRSRRMISLLPMRIVSWEASFTQRPRLIGYTRHRERPCDWVAAYQDQLAWRTQCMPRDWKDETNVCDVMAQSYALAGRLGEYQHYMYRMCLKDRCCLYQQSMKDRDARKLREFCCHNIWCIVSIWLSSNGRKIPVEWYWLKAGYDPGSTRQPTESRWR